MLLLKLFIVFAAFSRVGSSRVCICLQKYVLFCPLTRRGALAFSPLPLLIVDFVREEIEKAPVVAVPTPGCPLFAPELE